MSTLDKELFIKNLQSLETTRFGGSLSSEEISELLEGPVKPTKLTFKMKKKKKPDCDYFIKTAKKHKHIIYKYKPSIFWTGPAIVVISKKLEKVRKQFEAIPIKVDHDNDRNLIIVYPDIKPPKNFKWDKEYDPEDNPTEYWTYNGETYIVDMVTNKVFDMVANEVFDSSATCFIGFRINNELNFE